MANERIGIFVATMTGLSEICAEEISGALAAAGVTSEIRLMEAVHADAVDEFDTILIVSSTYGHGDIPDNGQAFYDALSERDTLAGKRFTVFALGDRTYSDTFCLAGEKWDTLLAAKGADRIVPLERHDASAGTLAEDEAAAWASGWAADLAMAA